MNNVEATLATIAEQLKQLTGKVDDAAAKRKEADDRLDRIEDRLIHVETATSFGLFEWLGNHWKIVAALSVPAPFLFTALIIGAWQMKGDAIISFVRAEIEASARNANVLYQPIGLSFVKTPVIQGGTAVYVLVARRTEFGLRCTYEHTVPIFTDELGRSLSGDFQPRGRQYGAELTRTEMALGVPADLLPGRVIAELQITYDCNGERLTERTYPVAFELLPSKPAE